MKITEAFLWGIDFNFFKVRGRIITTMSCGMICRKSDEDDTQGSNEENGKKGHSIL